MLTLKLGTCIDSFNTRSRHFLVICDSERNVKAQDTVVPDNECVLQTGCFQISRPGDRDNYVYVESISLFQSYFTIIYV